MRILRNFQQHNDPLLPDGAGKGICLTMSCWYLINAAKGEEDYWDWFTECAKAVHEMGNRTQHPTAYFGQMRSAGKLHYVGDIKGSTANLGDFLVDNSHGVWPWRLAVMDNPAFQMAHAIAYYSGLKPRVLDVTEGEFEFDSAADCKQWVVQHNAVARVRVFNTMQPYSAAFPQLTVYGFAKQ